MFLNKENLLVNNFQNELTNYQNFNFFNKYSKLNNMHIILTMLHNHNLPYYYYNLYKQNLKNL